MLKLKLFVVVAAFAIVIACSQAATNTTTPSANTNAAANTAKPANAANTNAPAANTAAAANSNSGSTTAALTGAELYKNQCANCHKPDGKGGKVTIDGKEIEPDDLTTDKMAKRPDEKFTKDIMEGFPDDGMPAFKDKMSAAEIQEVIKYLHSNIIKGGSLAGK